MSSPLRQGSNHCPGPQGQGIWKGAVNNAYTISRFCLDITVSPHPSAITHHPRAITTAPLSSPNFPRLLFQFIEVPFDDTLPCPLRITFAAGQEVSSRHTSADPPNFHRRHPSFAFANSTCSSTSKPTLNSLTTHRNRPSQLWASISSVARTIGTIMKPPLILRALRQKCLPTRQ